MRGGVRTADTGARGLSDGSTVEDDDDSRYLGSVAGTAAVEEEEKAYEAGEDEEEEEEQGENPDAAFLRAILASGCLFAFFAACSTQSLDATAADAF